jgi:nitrogen PTS system EIIA component
MRMNEISDILAVDCVDAKLTVTSKKSLFQQLASAAAPVTGRPAKEIVTGLSERERLGSTGFGEGIAIPHGKIEGLDRIYGFFFRLDPAIPYQAVDDLPVDLIFLLLSPADAGADHLKALAGVSRALRDRETVAKLRGARSRDAIYALLAGDDTLHAA